MSKAASMKQGVRDWVDSTLYEDAQPIAAVSRVTSQPRDSAELLGGCDVKELDPTMDTIPAELEHLFR
jgi:hypothetical protein